MKRRSEPVRIDSRKRQCMNHNTTPHYGNSSNILEVLHNKVKKYDTSLLKANAEIICLKNQVDKLTQLNTVYAQYIKRICDHIGLDPSSNMDECSYIS